MVTSTDHRPRASVQADPEDSVGALVSRASEQVSRLVRDELRLAQAEMTDKGKRFGIGGGMFGAAAIVAVVAFQALVATGIAALALAMPVWAAALIVTGALLVLAGTLAALGRKKVGQATPPVPEQAIDSVKADVAEIKERAHR
ncbi:phage holin family protein [Streptomyces specialis]|uniref:phage holin family protein n=1 Tax=Streptomyces specialis TaxID=498367 RepID=UPI000AD155DC|nr:phage holin family protein [Streptomyces specialis]